MKLSSVFFSSLLALLLCAVSVQGGADFGVQEPAPPSATAAVLDLQDQAVAEKQKGQTQSALATALRAAQAAARAKDWIGEATSYFFRASIHLEAGDYRKAIPELEAAEAAYARGDYGPARTNVLMMLAGYELAFGTPERFRGRVKQAASVGKADRRWPFLCSVVLETHAKTVLGAGAYSEAVLLYEACVTLREKAAPDSTPLALSCGNLGATLMSMGDASRAKPYLAKAFLLFTRLKPGSLQTALTENDLAGALRGAGDLTGARRHCEHALERVRVLAPGTLPHAQVLQNLGMIAVESGRLNQAQPYLADAWELHRKLDPESLPAANCRNMMGMAARAQGDLTGALTHWKAALAIQEKVAPDSLPLAATLNNVAELLKLDGDLDASQEVYERVVQICRKVVPGSQYLAIGLANLGLVAIDRGKLDDAERFFNEAIAMERPHAPRSLNIALALRSLGIVAAARKDYKTEAARYRECLAIQEKLAPGSMDVARTYANLGRSYLDQADLENAELYSAKAWEAVRDQGAAVAGEEAQREFGKGAEAFCSQLVYVRLARKRAAEALRTLEEGRARALRQQLAERVLDLRSVPPDRWAAYVAARSEQRVAGEELARAGAAEAVGEQMPGPRDLPMATAARLAAEQRYNEARLRAERAWAAVKAAAPQTFPEPTNLDQARARLPRGAVYLSFSLNPINAAVFVCRAGAARDAIRGFRLEVKGEKLGDLVRRFRASLTGISLSRGVQRVRVVGERSAKDRLKGSARELYEKLLPKEARAAVAGAERLIVSPDGPLWDLPFAALVDENDRYVGLEKPITYTPSLSLFGSGEVVAPTPGLPSLLVVGNPTAKAVPAGMTASERSSLYLDGRPPASLPSAEAEARAVGELYGAVPLLRDAATESAVRSRITHADVIHLATHGYLHPFRAMSSGLLLAPGAAGDPAQDGALQAWEVFDQLKLRADLVVLSACETGLGEKVAGEGLVGLTRAFQAAGARSVIASQWQVADASTRTLMVRLHRELRSGTAKDEALRRSMASVHGDAATSHPYHWAGFVLTGDPGNPLSPR